MTVTHAEEEEGLLAMIIYAAELFVQVNQVRSEPPGGNQKKPPLAHQAVEFVDPKGFVSKGIIF